MKRLVTSILASLLILGNIVPSFATEKTVFIEKMSNGLAIEYVLEETVSPRATYQKVGKKTAKVKSGSTVLWTVTVTGTFEYDGNHSTCTASSVSTSVMVSVWKIASKSASKSGSSATAKATGQRYSNNAVVETYTQSVSLVCGSDGTLY